MELILLKDIEKVGRKGEVVRVRDGFGRNFLLARGLGIQATSANREFVAEQRQRSENRKEKEKNSALTRAEQLKKIKVKISAKAGEQNKLFGSITPEDIASALSKQGHAFDKKQIHLEEPIRELGTWQALIELYPQVKAAITVEVVREA